MLSQQPSLDVVHLEANVLADAVAARPIATTSPLVDRLFRHLQPFAELINSQQLARSRVLWLVVRSAGLCCRHRVGGRHSDVWQAGERRHAATRIVVTVRHCQLPIAVAPPWNADGRSSLT